MKQAPKGSREFMDAPNARPSEEAYTDAMSRHGTANYTDVDAKVVSAWRGAHPDWDKEVALLNEEGEEKPYSEWTVDELKEEAANRGLLVSGKKAELVQRLEEYDLQPDAEE